MKVSKSFLLIFVFVLFVFCLDRLMAEDGTKKYYLVTKIGKINVKADRLRCVGEDKFLLLDKKKSQLSFWEAGGEVHSILDNLTSLIDFDYNAGLINLLYGEPGQLRKIYISSKLTSGKMKIGENPVQIDSVFNMNFNFAKPVSISTDRYNRYTVVADTGSVKSINSENKIFSLKFLNLKPGDILFDSFTRTVYLSDHTSKSLVKIAVDGKLEQLISNYDADNPFLLDVSNNLIILDKKNSVIAKLGSDKKFEVMLGSIRGLETFAMHKECDTILYASNNNSEILRIEEIPLCEQEPKVIASVTKDDQLLFVGSYLAAAGKKSKKYFSLYEKSIPIGKDKKLLDLTVDSLKKISIADEETRKEIRAKNGDIIFSDIVKINQNEWLTKGKSSENDVIFLITKKESGFDKKEILSGLFVSNPALLNSTEFIVINNEGKLVVAKLTGEKMLLTGGFTGFSRILAATNEYCYLLSDKGELLKLNYKNGKTLVMKNVSQKSEIIKSSSDVVFLKDGNKIYKLENGMQTVLQFLEEEKPALCYHRGYSAKAPENSISAFDMAFTSGGKLIEFDVQMTKDNELVILHDKSINRTSNSKGVITDLELGQLDTVEIGSRFSPNFKGEKIPVYNDVLKRYKNKLFLDIELKGSGVNDIDLFCKKVIDGIDQFSSVNEVLITSFDRKLLVKIREYNRDVLTGLLVDNDDEAKDMYTFMDENRINALVCNHKMLNKELVDSLKKKNKMVMVYTVNDKKDYDRCKELGADCIISNDPLALTSK